MGNMQMSSARALNIYMEETNKTEIYFTENKC